MVSCAIVHEDRDFDIERRPKIGVITIPSCSPRPRNLSHHRLCGGGSDARSKSHHQCNTRCTPAKVGRVSPSTLALLSRMKKIEAVVPPSSLGMIRAELVRRGVCGTLTVTEVRHGETHGPVNGDSDESLKDKIKVELIIPGRQIDKAVNVILRHAMTDSSDRYGHVTLLHVDEILQITHPMPS
jgi:nitrogen regulatory protein PII